jgi:hypothetical protein
MKPGERMDYMKQKVLPRMTAVFQESGSKDFEEVNCVTCHGSRAEQGNFEMPNEDLLPLDVSDGFADEKKAHPEMMKFMGERVVPEMASLLGEEPYNQKRTGFRMFWLSHQGQVTARHCAKRRSTCRNMQQCVRLPWPGDAPFAVGSGQLSKTDGIRARSCGDGSRETDRVERRLALSLQRREICPQQFCLQKPW